MASWLFIVESNCIDPARENEFNEWYNQTHIPDIMSTECIDRATRCELTTQPPEGKGKYLAVYEIESDNIKATMSEFRDKIDVIAKGRMSNLMKATSRCVYRQIASFPE